MTTKASPPQSGDTKQAGKIIHPLFVRITHWINALAVFIMLMSGLKIYNASPIYPLQFPPDITLGGWLAGALAWHFAGMWLLAREWQRQDARITRQLDEIEYKVGKGR